MRTQVGGFKVHSANHYTIEPFQYRAVFVTWTDFFEVSVQASGVIDETRLGTDEGDNS